MALFDPVGVMAVVLTLLLTLVLALWRPARSDRHA